jgi:polyvinyl alcohol dehydrogenase (cytochrome)
MRAIIALLLLALPTAVTSAQEAAKLYTDNCARCHDHDIRAPSRAALGKLEPARIITALEKGSMREVGSKLTDWERQSVAAFLGNHLAGETARSSVAGQCVDASRKLSLSGPHWNGWGASLTNDRYSIATASQATRRNGVGTQLYGPSGAGTYSPPTIDTRLKRLYFTTGNSYSEPAAETSDAVLGVDLKSGRIVWATQLTPGDAFNVACMQPDKTNCPVQQGEDLDFASPAILLTTPANIRLLIAGQKSGMVYALNPDDNGRKVWSTRVAVGGLLGGIMWGAAADGDTVYIAVSDSFTQGRLNPDAGGLVALRSSDGKQLWRIPAPTCGDREPCLPAQTAAVTLIPGVVFSGSRDGFLRAYSSISGRILWEFATAREFETVNGVKGNGGTLDVSGAAVVDGIVLTTSGYSQFGGIAGNVLLAFSIGGT